MLLRMTWMNYAPHTNKPAPSPRTHQRNQREKDLCLETKDVTRLPCFRMEPKKNKVFSRLRDRTKPLFNVKIGKKAKKTPLKYRRSISVPDLRCGQSTPPTLGAFLDQDETESETSSLACSETFSVTDGTLPVHFKDQYLDVPSSAKPCAHDQHTSLGTNQSSAPYLPPPAQLLDQHTASGTPSAAKAVEKFPFPDPVVLKRFSASDLQVPPERPTSLDLHASSEKPDKKTDEGEKRTTWYVDDPDDGSVSSTPSEEPSFSWFPEHEFAAGTEDMCISGSAEDATEVPNESNDYDTSVSGGEKKAHKVHYILTINLKEGKNLVIRDKSGTSDPYVKFKSDGKTVYKSKVMYRNLNPVWNESFSFPIKDLEHTISVQVYDRDLRSHDFMGSGTILVSKLELDRTSEMILRLEDADSPEHYMGVIILDVGVTVQEGPAKRSKWPLKRKGSFNKGQPQQGRVGSTKNQVWSEVYRVVLVEGQDMPEGGQGDLYVLFSLGDQRFRSKNQCIKTNPQWREAFEFNHFDDGQSDTLVVEVFCKRGRKREESWGLLEFDLSKLAINQTQTYTHLVVAGKGRLVFLVTRTPCPGATVSELGSAPLDHVSTCENMLKQYSLERTLRNLHDVGYLQVKVLRAADLPSTDLNRKSDPFCVLELGNCKLQTQTIYKTLNPEWKTAFTFPIKDIHDVLELTVYGEDGDKARDFLGTVAIPLLTVSNGQQITILLKKEGLTGPSKGSITLEMSVFYNPVRAAVRTFTPKEKKFVEDNPKFNKKLLARNIYRVRRISMAVLYTLQYIKSCFQWESTQRSITALLIFVGTVWHFELFMLPLFLLLLIGWNYFHITPGTGSHSQDLENVFVAEDEDEDEKESEKRGLMEKIHMVQEIVLTVQNVLDEVACIGERVKNTFNWSVPFLSFLACVLLFVSTAALYYVPLRYIVLLWGVTKFAKKLLQPHAIDNNELLDFLKRVPSDVQKVQYSELRVAAVPSLQKKKR
ncbi:multiple C2 and transmembrane domain-containing protein 2 isoform X2 [Hoplias malabaricus]|uniref:multiple C2 and transmembrane domain-containing protein 2 isoform X2 n=1 Tax=Hoplias malabaricus TaxID=27720 RepID=UPI003463487A